jgi:hypothetical protein
VSQALERVRQTARQRKKERFTALLHHISIDCLRTAFFALKRDAASGVDGLTWPTYEADLDRNLTDLHERVHRGAYRALPSRRTYIPKADGKQRPLAVAALEDKIVQRATAAVLNAIYEEDFLGFSYGFRPKRGQHDALDALVVGIKSRRVNFIFDADVASFFDSVSKDWLVRFVEHRIGDPRIIRLIQKWLKAGVLEDGVVQARHVVVREHGEHAGGLCGGGRIDRHRPAVRDPAVDEAAWAAFAMARSAVYWALPVTLCRPSTREIGCPMAFMCVLPRFARLAVRPVARVRP